MQRDSIPQRTWQRRDFLRASGAATLAALAAGAPRAARGEAAAGNHVARPPDSSARSGCSTWPFVIAIRQPAATAMRAASSFVRMPPEPCGLPGPPAISQCSGRSSATSPMCRAPASAWGSAVYRPSTSDNSTRQSLLIICATRAARRSLSP